MASVNVDYISCGINRVPGCIDWGPKWLACGFSNAVGLCSISSTQRSIAHTLPGHIGRVNCVRWVTSKQNNLLLSGAADSKIIVWKKTGLLECEPPLSCFHVLTGHCGSIISVDGLMNSSSELLMASASVDSTIKIWTIPVTEESPPLQCHQTLSLGSGLCLSLKLSVLPNKANQPILACSFDTTKVGIYVQTQDGMFESGLILAGHEDWVRGMDFIDWNGALYLATSSQDCYIRVWKFEASPTIEEDIGDELKMQPMIVSNSSVRVTLDGVLCGHTQWVLGVHWSLSSSLHSPQLLSASMDKSMVVWSQDPDTSMWSERIRVGDVGGNTLGFLGCQFSPDGAIILAHGFQGGVHMWSQLAQDSLDVWPVEVSVGGHSDGVQDLSWEPSGGHYLLSTGDDQTTRLHAVWSGSPSSSAEWHEICRPQVHGYDMTSLACIDAHTFVSSGDEKVVRVFRAPRNFRDNFTSLTGCHLQTSSRDDSEQVPQGAMIPALGLSNKAIIGSDNQEAQLSAMMADLELPCEDVRNQYAQAYFRPQAYKAPPSEDNLIQNTLWPETKKLYGHGFEVFTIAAHPQGLFIATASKAAKPEFASVLLWSTKDWNIVQTLLFHQLTVTQIVFSHSGLSLLVVSRDRSWSLWRQKSVNDPYELAGHSDKKTGHLRIIWSADFTFDDRYFLTGSRDKQLISWCSNTLSLAGPKLTLPESITAVSCAPDSPRNYLVAAGLEDGTIHLLSWQPGQEWIKLCLLDQCTAHCLSVKRLQFRPVCSKDGSQQLASCSMDHCVKVFSVNYSSSPH